MIIPNMVYLLKIAKVYPTTFFINLLDMSTVWNAKEGSEEIFEGRNRKTKDIKWTATRADLLWL